MRLVSGLKLIRARSVMTREGAPKRSPARARDVPPVRCPGLVMKSTCSTKRRRSCAVTMNTSRQRSEEHTSELQSQLHLVCRLLLEKKQHPPAHNPAANGIPAMFPTPQPTPTLHSP